MKRFKKCSNARDFNRKVFENENDDGTVSDSKYDFHYYNESKKLEKIFQDSMSSMSEEETPKTQRFRD